MSSIKTILFFVTAGLFEIAGGYMVWIWLKNDKPFWYGIMGMVLLALYGFIPVLQNANFGKVYAAYGGVFIILSLLWGWKIDGIIPGKWDVIGSMLCLAGVMIIMGHKNRC